MLPAYLNIHTHVATGQADVLEIVSAHGQEPLSAVTLWRSVGWHPWYVVPGAYDDWQSPLLAWANAPNVLAIGESGLDKVTHTPWPTQLAAFRASVAASQALGKPLIIHCVRAWEEVLAVLREHHYTNAIFHGYAKHAPLARRLVEAGHCLSFGAALRQPAVAAALQAIPADRFLLETDGQHATIQTVYAAAAEALALPLDALQANLHRTFRRLFGVIDGSLQN